MMATHWRDTIAGRYAKACDTPSDIYEHLHVFVELVRKRDAKKVIELGTRSGVSTVAWLYGLDVTDGDLWSVDIDTPVVPSCVAESPRWIFVHGDDLDAQTFAALPNDVDIVFIDTSHMYAQTMAELNLYRWKMRPGGTMVLHDTELAFPEGWTRAQPRYPVKVAVKQFCEAEGLTPRFLPNCFGLALIDIPEV